MRVIISLLTLALTASALASGTASYSDQQSYLKPAPVGIGAEAVWSRPGGRGENVKIIDIESGFNDRHEDLNVSLLGDNSTLQADHGTAVMGILSAQDNGFGITGIAHQAQATLYAFKKGQLSEVNDLYLAAMVKAIRESVALLGAGDVLLIEQHMFGPDKKKYTAVEYWPEIFKELKAATDKGIHCIQAAGNGDSNLDHKAYKGAFDLKVRDSGCILVGAGDPLSKERLPFSNYGSRIDAQGFGKDVVTTGYGDLLNLNLDQKYTAKFSGTSSAAPIVAGAVALVSSMAKSSGKQISPREMREALRETGTPQGKKTTKTRIGSLPDLNQLIIKFEL